MVVGRGLVGGSGKTQNPNKPSKPNHQAFWDPARPTRLSSLFLGVGHKSASNAARFEADLWLGPMGGGGGGYGRRPTARISPPCIPANLRQAGEVGQVGQYQYQLAFLGHQAVQVGQVGQHQLARASGQVGQIQLVVRLGARNAPFLVTGAKGGRTLTMRIIHPHHHHQDNYATPPPPLPIPWLTPRAQILLSKSVCVCVCE